MYFKTIFVVAVPFVLALFAAYLVGSFINVSFNPADWERDARIVIATWGIGFGVALYMKLYGKGLA